MVTINGTISLSGVSDKEMALIWDSKAKHGAKLQFNPQLIQINNRQDGTFYNNVTFGYSDLHSFNTAAEVVNELHKKEESTKASGQ